MLKEYEQKQVLLQAEQDAEDRRQVELQAKQQQDFEEMQQMQAKRERMAQEDLMRQQMAGMAAGRVAELEPSKDEMMNSLQDQVSLWRHKYEALAKLYLQLRTEHLDMLSKFKAMQLKANSAQEAIDRMERMECDIKAKNLELADMIRERDCARKRDYSTNPRSPPKRRRRTGEWKKEILPELQNSSKSIFPNPKLIPHSTQSHINLVSDLSTLPPLPDSPILHSSETLSQVPTTPHPIDTSKRYSPDTPNSYHKLSLPISPISRLTSIFSHLTIRNSKELLLKTVNARTIKRIQTISEKQFTHTSIRFNENPKYLPTQNLKSPFIKSEMSGTSKSTELPSLTTQDISKAKDSLGDETKFEPLTTNGSNFVEWKKETARAIKALLGIKNYWDNELPIESYIDRKRDGIAMSVINNTIHKTSKNITDDADSAYEAMEALQNHFKKGGRTAQFALFSRLMNLRLDGSDNEMINHMLKVDTIIAELESTGFEVNSTSLKGLFYQIVMAPEMTKEINKELDNKYDKKNPTYNLKDIKSEIQIYLARERTASEMININSLNAQFDMMAVNTRINPMRWRRGPPAWSKDTTARDNSKMNMLEIPPTALGGVKAGLPQCFFCGAFGHGYLSGGCESYDGNGDRTGAHYVDWRRVSNRKWYSLNVLYPNQSNQMKNAPRINSAKISDEMISSPSDQQPTIMNLDWASEGFGTQDNGSEISTEYLFDGGATDAERVTLK
ncbi:hypothetical protein DFH28DRAFT_1197911 [Melampsora americana]|nr:hypothetical protein DFH28DRAFT_1197911 [Melampsora americana]